ncbi:MAG: hypothetical protein COA66_16010 [Arcobacter sp.]|nr:MAG: hypothetical protein COA66_16010 [Arcobacter sp.]
MFIFQSKEYDLYDIERLFSKIPLIFIIFLASFLLIITFFILETKKNTKINLLKQEHILSYKFNQKEKLLKFLVDVKEDVANNFIEVEDKLKEVSYKAIGYLDSNALLDLELVKKYLVEIEKKSKIEFVLFKKNNLEILYGRSSIVYISDLIFTSNNNKNAMKITLQYIHSQGINNLQYWSDDLKKTIRLSFFDSILIKGEEYFIGSFSTVNSIKKITQKSILSLIKKSKEHFWFYDVVLQDAFNFHNKQAFKSNASLLKNKNKSENYDILEYYLDSYEQNKVFSSFSHFYSKFNFILSISNNNSSLSKENLFLISEIRLSYTNMFFQIFVYILIVVSILILFTFVFTNFIKKIFGQYYAQLQKNTISLEHWKKRFELAIIASNDGLWDIDFKSNKIYFSKQWLDMFGYNKNEIEDFPSWFALIHKDDKNKVEQLFEKIFNKESDSIVCEYRLKSKNGNYKWVLARGKVFLDDEGVQERMLMMSMDIDRSKLMKKELLDIELLVEDGKIVIFKLFNDENLSVKYISKSIKSYGYIKNEFENKNRNFIDLIYKEDIPIVKVAINAALKQNLLDFTFVCRALNAGSEIRWISCRCILLKNHEGEVSHFYGYMNDITKIKVSQEELKVQIEHELKKNREKDRILIQQSKLAAMGEMLGNISHQWRQPLNNVSLILQFLRDNYKNANSETLDKFILRANNHINYMSQTIDDFRNFYKPSKNKNSFYINECMDSLLYMIKHEYKNENIKIIYDFESILIYNYENELKQALLNILNNAKDALLEKRKKSSFDAFIKIDIKKAENKLFISIFNNGGNIEELIMDRIFEPYFTTKFETQGTGIGLYMTKAIIENNMKGSITAKNENDGVDFVIVLNIEDKKDVNE